MKMQAQNTPQASSTPVKPNTEERKRKRDVLSCVDCRRRKLKCDRGYPACSRCVKGGIAAACTYQSFQGGSNGHDDDLDVSLEEDGPPQKRPRGPFSSRLTELVGEIRPPTNFLQSKSSLSNESGVVRSLESRLAALERLLSHDSASEGFSPAESRRFIPATTRRRCDEPESHIFKGKGLSTQFYGPSNPTTLLAHFPEVRAFMKEAHANSNLQRLQNECNVADERLRKDVKDPPKPTVDLLELVPAREVAESLVKLYLDTFETTYRILHRPTFWRDYEAFWHSPTQASTGFVPVMLLVMATVRCMSPNESVRFSLEGSTVRAEAVQWIYACDAWLKEQSQKHKTTAMYQVMCLRILASSASALKTKRAYVDAENVLNYFRSAGMHRDPHLLDDRCKPYEAEMRRRLWATITELELQASIDRGMPSSLCTITVDCLAPLNIDDDTFTESSVRLPSPRPSGAYTETSFLDISSRSLSLRISLCSLVNESSTPMEYEDVLKYEQHINDALDSIPKWEGQETTHASTLLDLQLRQFFLLIHTPSSRHATSSHSRYSRMVCFETAKHILNQHFKLISSNNFGISLVRDDIYRAALTMCHNAFLCSLNPKDMFFQGILINISLVLDEAFKNLEEKCTRRGEGFQYYWHVSAAWGLLEYKLGRQSFDVAKVQSTERIAKLYRKVLEFQEGPRKLPELPLPVSVTQNGVRPHTSAFWNTTGSILGFNETPSSAGPFNYSDAFDYSDWTLDNLWPLDMQQGQLDMNFLG